MSLHHNEVDCPRVVAEWPLIKSRHYCGAVELSGSMPIWSLTGKRNFCLRPRYTNIPVPALVIFANPHSLGTWVDDNTDSSVRTAAKAYSAALAAFTER